MHKNILVLFGNGIKLNKCNYQLYSNLTIQNFIGVSTFPPSEHNIYTMIFPPIRGDYPLIKARELSPREDGNHGLTTLISIDLA